jgi:hypothetical protein
VHDALRVREIRGKKSITKTDDLLYSPKFSLCDFFLFPELENDQKEQRFGDIPDIQRNVTTSLRGIPEKDFQDCFRQRHPRLTRCIASQEEYFVGDSSH